MHRKAIFAIAGTLHLTLSACGFPTHADLQAAASMQVEVDVYKGPLSKEPMTQWAEMIGTLVELMRSLERFATLPAPNEDGLQRSLTSWAVRGGQDKAGEWLSRICDDVNDIRVATYRSCRTMTNVFYQGNEVSLPNSCEEGYFTYDQQVRPSALDLVRPSPPEGSERMRHLGPAKNATSGICRIVGGANVDPPRRPGPDEANAKIFREALTSVSALARQMEKKSLFWSSSHVGYEWPSKEVRAPLVSFSAMLSMYADRIGARADTLLQQINVAERRDLPLSIALRETAPPAALQQYVWNDAATGGIESREHARDKVRAIERLYSNENWTRINTVHASGQGKVRMALIKDDIGNWNLKNFDQDPTDLLNAYKNVGLAGLKAAATLAASASSGGGAAALASALQLANQVAGESLPGGSPTIGSRDVTALRQTLIDDLEKMKAETQVFVVQQDKVIAKAEAAIAIPKAAVDSSKKDYETALAEFRKEPNSEEKRREFEEKHVAYRQAEARLEEATAAVAVAKRDKEQYSQTVAAQIREKLLSHEQLILALERGVSRQRRAGVTLPDNVPKLNVVPPVPVR